MNFSTYKEEVSKFLMEHYTNLKGIKVNNSEFALKEFLLTEQADINNYASSIIRRIVSDARKEFIVITDEETGYELGKELKVLVKVPEFEKIKIDFSTSEKMEEMKEATKNFISKSPANKAKKSNVTRDTGITAGSAVATVGILALVKAPALIIGITAVVVAGVVWTVLHYINENGDKKVKYIEPPTKIVKRSSQASNNSRKFIEHNSMEQLLDIRKQEVETVLYKAIDDARLRVENIQKQLQTN